LRQVVIPLFNNSAGLADIAPSGPTRAGSMRHRHTITILCLAAAAVAGTEPAGAAQRTSTGLVGADPKAAYALVKRLVAEDPDVRARLQDPAPAGNGTATWSYGCPIVTVPAGAAADGLDRFVEIALLSVLHRNEIAKLGYPKKDVDRIMDGVEAKLLAVAIPLAQGRAEASAYAAALHRLEWPTVAAFARVRTGLKRKPTPIVVPEDCFDEGFEKSVVTTPPGGEVRLLSDFAARFCRAQGLDPDDPALCDRWTEPSAEASAGHWGDHRYQITWPDGKTARGAVRIEIDQSASVTVPTP
jgi:hypothetical protein